MAPAATAKPSHEEVCLLIEVLIEAAAKFVARERGEVMVRKWLPQRDRDVQDISEDRMVAMMADVVLLSEDLLLSQPSASGATAFDRLARSRTNAPPWEAEAVAALCRARFRLLRLDQAAGGSEVCARDVVSSEVLRIAGADLPPLAAGTILFGRVAMVGEGIGCLAGVMTPLDIAAAATAISHPAAGASATGASARWAEAVYAHVVRHGTLDVPGLNRPTDEADQDDLFGPGQGELQDLVMAWLAIDEGAPDANLLQRTRQSADLPTILDALAAAVLARDAGRDEMAIVFERLLLVQLETVQRRERSGAGVLTLDVVARGLDEAMAKRGWPQRVRTFFEMLRAKLAGGRLAKDPTLERLVQRIQGLRAKTVAQGCTEQEALAAAEKVAELLDRYGLSLGEMEFRAQPCEGIGIQTTRRRIAPIDECIPAIAAFFDCRVWAERAEAAPLRYIFFGLRGDVTAAEYLYEMVERAFETETDAFRASDVYFQMVGERRSATNSFQIGLARGISGKLRTMRAAREAVTRSASGRDLVPAKAAMVDEEMEKLGLRLSSRALGRGKRVLADAFAAGEAAGQRFEFAPAITEAA
jgi:Protein of unknown function (DUF2786)